MGFELSSHLASPANVGPAREIVPVRRIRNGKPRNTVIGKFPSRKMNRMVRFESGLERDFIFWCEFDPLVVAYVEQPFRIEFIHQGQKRRYTPDFLLEWKGGPSSVIEVKPSSHLLQPKLALKLRLASSVIREQGFGFVVATEKEIRRDPHLPNIRLLHRYSRVITNVSVYLACTNYLLSKPEVTFAELHENVSSKGVTKPHIYSLLFKGSIWSDLDTPLTEQSILRLPPQQRA